MFVKKGLDTFVQKLKHLSAFYTRLYDLLYVLKYTMCQGQTPGARFPQSRRYCSFVKLFMYQLATTFILYSLFKEDIQLFTEFT